MTHPKAPCLFALESIRHDIPAEIVVAKQPPLAASADPSTSFEAAEHVKRSGKLGRHRTIMLKAVQSYPGRTARELAQISGLERHEASRRLADLKNMGLVRQGPKRVCNLGGRREVTWLEIAP